MIVGGHEKPDPLFGWIRLVIGIKNWDVPGVKMARRRGGVKARKPLPVLDL
jgi:hypothetical protein